MGNTHHAVKPSILDDRNQGWRAPIRCECVGGNVNDVIKAEAAFLPQKLVYAEGDSWFDKFTPLPLRGTNLLDAIRTPFHAMVVDVAHIGDEASEIVSGWQARQTEAMFDLFRFDLILLSAGGNDLKNLFAELFRIRAAERGNAAWTPAELATLANPANYTAYFNQVTADLEKFFDIRDKSSKNAATKIIMNGYDYLQPRPAGAAIFAGSKLGTGPWLYPVMKAAGLTSAQMRAATDAVVDELNRQLGDLCKVPANNALLIDSRGLLKPAAPETTGPDADWMDEIHPTEEGFTKLARNRWNVPIATALGWQPAGADLVVAAAPVNGSTAVPSA